LVVAFVALAAVHQATANAQTLASPDYWKQTAERQSTVDRFIYTQSPQSIPSGYSPVAEAEEILRQAQQSLPPSNPQARTIWTQIRGVTVKAGLSTPLRALGTIGLAAGVFEIGWKIGSGVNAKFLKFGLPEASPGNGAFDALPEVIEFKTAGTALPQTGGTMPEDGWLWRLDAGRYVVERPGSDPCSRPLSPPVGFTRNPGQVSGTFCGPPYMTYQVALDSYYLPEGSLASTAPIENYTNQAYTRTSGAPTAPAQSTVEQAIETELDKSENETLRNWLNYVLGSPGAEDPTGIGAPNPVTIPAPDEAETATEYAARLDELRLKTTVTEADEVDPAKGPSEVISVEPEPGTSVQTDSTVTVRANRPKDCETPLFHYTDLTDAAAIMGTSTIIASAQNGPYPSGAYATTISPAAALTRFDDQYDLADHLFSEGEKPVAWWVMLCAEDNPEFHPTPDVPPDRLDFWNASAASGVPVPVDLAGTGPNPLPRGF
jgi:hypothetical protein